MKSAGDTFTFKSGEGEAERVYSYPMREVRSLAGKLGMDLEVDKSLLWFLKEALLAILPQGWQREEDAHGTTKYHNNSTGVTTETHPLLYVFRAAFCHLLEASCSAAAAPKRDERQTLRQKRLEPNEIVSLRSPEEQKSYFQDLLKKIEKKQEGMKDPDKFEQTMKEADLFYSSLFNGARVPRFLEDSLEYQCVDPQVMLSNSTLLGVRDDYRLLWLGRVLAVIPLPPLWKREYDQFHSEVYVNSQYNLVLPHHPAKQFLTKFAQTLRFGDILPSSPIMTFLDRKLRAYDVDLLRLTRGEEYVIRRSEFPVLRKQRNRLAKPSHIDTVDDIMMLEIAESCGIEFNREPHIAGVVYSLREVLKESLQGWEFRYTLQGQRYWYHTRTQRAAAEYPFVEQLRKVVDEARLQYARLAPDLLKTKEEVHPGFLSSPADVLHTIRRGVTELMSSHLHSFLTEGKLQEQDASAVAALLPISPDTRPQLDDLLFACPYHTANVPEDFWTLDVANLRFHLPSEDTERSEQSVIIGSVQTRRSEQRSRGGQSLLMKSLLPKPRHSELMGDNLLSQHRQSVMSNASRRSSMKLMTRRDVKEVLKEKALEAMQSLKGVRSISEVATPVSPVMPGSGFSRVANKLTSQPVKLEAPLFPQRPASPRHKIEPEENQQRRTPKSTDRSETGPPSKSFNRDFRLALAQSSRFRSALFLPTAQSAPELHLPPDSSETKSTVGTSPQSLVMAAISKSMLRLTTRSAEKQQAIETESALKSMLTRSLFVREKSGQSQVERAQEAGEESKGEEKTTEEGKAQETQGLLETEKQENIGTEMQLEGKGIAQLEQPQVPKDTAQAEKPQETGLYKALLRSILQDKVTHLLAAEKKKPPTLPLLEPEATDSILLQSPSVSAILSDPSSPIIVTPKVLNQRQSEQLTFTSALVSPASSPQRLQTPNSSINSPQFHPLQGAKKHRERSERSTEVSAATASKSVLNLDSFSVVSTPVSPQQRLVKLKKKQMSDTLSPLMDKHLAYYMTAFGSPFQSFDMERFKTIPGIQPGDIVAMGQRLGIRVSQKAFESVESDLLWIAYFQILAPLPPLYHRLTLTEALRLPIGKHPGDSYFALVLEHYRLIRAQELKSMSKSQRIQSMVEKSWLELRNDENSGYRYNFLTGEKGLTTAMQFVKFKKKAFVHAPIQGHKRISSLQIPRLPLKQRPRTQVSVTMVSQH